MPVGIIFSAGDQSCLSREILRGISGDGEKPSPAGLLIWLEPYRAAAENLLSAPYGSSPLLNLEALDEIVRELTGNE